MLFSWLMAAGTAACSSVSAPPPVTARAAPVSSRKDSSNTVPFSTVTVHSPLNGASSSSTFHWKQAPGFSSIWAAVVPSAPVMVRLPPLVMPPYTHTLAACP